MSQNAETYSMLDTNRGPLSATCDIPFCLLIRLFNEYLVFQGVKSAENLSMHVSVCLE